jgi:hypothetical protein
VEECEVVVGLVVWFRVGFVVGCVCWRHTTIYDGTWVLRMLAADVNVMTLGKACVGAPALWRGGFCKRWQILCVRNTVGGTWVGFELGGARAVGGQSSKFGKLRLVVCTVWCRYGSTNLSELGSVGKR